MHSIRTRLTSLTMSVTIIALCIATAIAAVSIRNLGRDDADEMIRLTCTTGALNLETYFESVESSVEMISMLVQDSFEGVTQENLDSQIENARHLFERASYITHGVLTYYFRIDPEVSQTAKGFWYVYQEGVGFREHEVTDISQYDTNDTSALVWFTVPNNRHLFTQPGIQNRRRRVRGTAVWRRLCAAVSSDGKTQHSSGGPLENQNRRNHCRRHG